MATRVDDGTLYYHLNDPTGTSLVMVDGNGDAAGRMVYDGFGMVMENTLPAELTGTLPDVPDAATGLVHLGGGRWYDPALGRPLQPNPAGGPPTAPQALNRYAATPLGQPGVMRESIVQSNDVVNWAATQSVKIRLGKIAEALYEPYTGSASRWITQKTGEATIQIQAERQLIPEALQRLSIMSSQSPKL